MMIECIDDKHKVRRGGNRSAYSILAEHLEKCIVLTTKSSPSVNQALAVVAGSGVQGLSDATLEILDCGRARKLGKVERAVNADGW
jgi:hypothetical protein